MNTGRVPQYRSYFLLVSCVILGSVVPAVPPGVGPTPVVSQGSLEAKWLSLGDTVALDPVAEATVGGVNRAANLGLSPVIDGEPVQSWQDLDLNTSNIPPNFLFDDNHFQLALPNFSAFPNTYMALCVQGIFGRQFHPSADVRELSGAVVSSLLAMEPANNLKRNDVIGVHFLGVKEKASAYGDSHTIFTAMHVGTSISAKEFEGNNYADWKKRRWFVDLVCSSLNEVFLAAPFVSPYDARQRNGINAARLHVKVLAGLTALGYLDMPADLVQADADVSNSYLKRNPPSGTVFYGALFRWIYNSYVAVGTARIATAKLDLLDEGGVLPGTYSTNSQPRAINTWTGFRVRANSVAQNVINEFERIYAIFLTSQAVDAFVESSEGYRYLSLYSNGVNVLGDSVANASDTGSSTDVVHVRDLMRIAGTGGADQVNRLPPSQRSGVLKYFLDKSANNPKPPGLYVSVPSSSSPYFEWKRLNFDLSDTMLPIVLNRAYTSAGRQVRVFNNDDPDNVGLSNAQLIQKLYSNMTSEAKKEERATIQIQMDIVDASQERVFTPIVTGSDSVVLKCYVVGNQQSLELPSLSVTRTRSTGEPVIRLPSLTLGYLQSLVSSTPGSRSLGGQGSNGSDRIKVRFVVTDGESHSDEVDISL